MSKAKWIYVYVGYWEAYITDKRLNTTAELISKHRTVENAEKFVERNYPSATILYDKDIKDLIWWAAFMGEDNFYSLDYVCNFSNMEAA